MVSVVLLGQRSSTVTTTALHLQLLHRTAQAFGCQTQEVRESILWKRNLEKLTHFDEAEQNSQPHSVHSLAESNIGPLLPSDWHCHNPHGIVCVSSSYLETFGSPLGSGISLCYGKLFSLNILNSIFSKSLKTFEGYLLSIHDFCINFICF